MRLFFSSASKTLPAVDYVSVVRSVYADKRSMLHGALGSALAAGIAGVEAGAVSLLVIAGLFVLIGALRYLDMTTFDRAELAEDDVAGALRWELRATLGAAAIAALYGAWCLWSFWLVRDPFAELISASVSVSVLVGVTARNFSLDRLMTVQVILIAVPMALGLWLTGNPYYAVLSLVLLPFFFSLRRISGNVRQILLHAVHGRIEASRLAAELNTALATMPNGLCLLDERGRIAIVNQNAATILPELPLQRAVGRRIGAVIREARAAGSVSEPLYRQLLRALSEGPGPRKAEVEVGPDRHVEISVNSVDDHTVVMIEDVSARVQALERIHHLARFDGLTNLVNRTFFAEQLAGDLACLRQSRPDEPVMLLMLDLDDFKHVNDTYGHLVGDGLLVEVADRLRRQIGDDGLVARFGGDEFVVFFFADVSADAASELAADLLALLSKPFGINDHHLNVHASIGIVVGRAADEPETLMMRADLALYQAKGMGKAQWCLFEDAMDVDYRHRQLLKEGLRAAIAAKELSLAYQPIIELAGRSMVGVEALARWTHRQLGPIGPATFIPIAEEIGVMTDITRWVLETATRQCAQWPAPLRVAVNLSVLDFRNTDVVAMVAEALAASGLPAERLEIELTESSLIEERETVARVLAQLRAMGVGIALDDFGTGYSSLSYLNGFPFTKLKIDQSFVTEIDASPRAATLLFNIAKLAKDLSMTVTIEGIERSSQLEAILAGADIDQGQGYLFGAPLPASAITEKIPHHKFPHRINTRLKA